MEHAGSQASPRSRGRLAAMRATVVASENVGYAQGMKAVYPADIGVMASWPIRTAWMMG